MATHTINLNTFGNVLSAVPNTLTVAPGDTIVFEYFFGSTPIDIYPPSGLFTLGSVIFIPSGGSASRTITSSANGKYIFSSSNPQWNANQLFITVEDPVDDVPDPFDLTDISDAAKDTFYVSNEVDVSGINVPVPISITGNSATFQINDGDFSSTTRNANSGDTVRVRMKSSSLDSAQVSATLDMNGTSDTWTITTAGGSNGELLIPFNKTVFGFRELAEFFGGDFNYTLYDKFSAYTRGGDLVPDITENSSIPTSSSGMKLSDFANCYHAAFWTDTAPITRTAFISDPAPSPHIFSWTMNESNPDGNPYIGYNFARTLLEFRWKYSLLDPTLPSGVTVVGKYGLANNPNSTIAHNTWSSWLSYDNTKSFNIEVGFNNTAKGSITGTVYLEVRVASSTSQILSPRVFGWNITIREAVLG